MKPKLIVSVLLFTALFSLPSHAILGIGIGKGFDFSIKLPDTQGKGESAIITGLDSLKYPIGGNYFGAPYSIYLSRTNFSPTLYDIGGKFYVDVIPGIDGLEFSIDYGAWSYDAALSRLDLVPDYIDLPSGTPDSAYLNWTTSEISRSSSDMTPVRGVTSLSFERLDLFLSIRKYIAQFPLPTKNFKIYAGGGICVRMATPVITANRIAKELSRYSDNSQLQYFNDLTNLFNAEVYKTIIQQITESGMSERSGGLQLLIGFQMQPPTVPISLYIDGRFLLPISRLDSEIQFSGIGFTLDAGLCITISGNEGMNKRGFQ